MRIPSALPYACMPIVQQQRIRVADLCANDAQIACCVEEARVPALPVWQQLFYLFAQVHCVNVYEPLVGFNDLFRHL